MTTHFEKVVDLMFTGLLHPDSRQVFIYVTPKDYPLQPRPKVPIGSIEPDGTMKISTVPGDHRLNQQMATIRETLNRDGCLPLTVYRGHGRPPRVHRAYLQNNMEEVAQAVYQELTPNTDFHIITTEVVGNPPPRFRPTAPKTLPVATSPKTDRPKIDPEKAANINRFHRLTKNS